MKLEIPPFFNGKNLFVQVIFLLLFILGGASIFSAFGVLTGLAFFPASTSLHEPVYTNRPHHTPVQETC